MIRASVLGRLGGDPVQRETKTGKAMVTVSAAVDVSRPGHEPVTEWINLAAFGSVGEVLARHGKGDVITAMGALTRSSFTGRDGQERAGWNLLVEAVLSVRTARSSGGPRQIRTSPLRREPRHPAMPPPGPLADDRVDDLWRNDAP